MPKARKSARADDRKIMNAIFYVLRTGMPWRDLPERYGPYTTAYNRFNRWSRRNLNRQGRKPTGSEISVVLKGLAPVHPGEILREGFLAPIHLSPHALALAIGLPPARIAA